MDALIYPNTAQNYSATISFGSYELNLIQYEIKMSSQLLENYPIILYSTPLCRLVSGVNASTYDTVMYYIPIFYE